MHITARNFVLVMIATASLGAGVALGKANLQPVSGAQDTTVAAGASFVYFPVQYPLNAPNQVNEHIQAF